MSMNYAFMVEINDLTASVIWANIPDANVPQSAVTQHEAAIDHDALTNFLASEHFTEASISIPLTQGANDVTATFTELNLLDLAGLTARDVLVASAASAASWRALVEADISDLQAYLTAEINDLSAAVTWANIPDANVPQSAVTQHEAALTITRSQISDMPQATTAELEQDTDAINTSAAKVLGYAVLNTTTGVTVFASGLNDTDVWHYYDGTTAHTPV